MATASGAVIRAARRHAWLGWMDAPVVILGVVTAVGAAGIGGGSIRLVFAATALVAGIVYYRSSPERYVQFALWMWFLCPMLRRVVDLRFGYDPHSAMSVTPLAVSAIAAAGVLRRLPGLRRRSRAPFLLLGAALLYGLFVGLLRAGPQAALYTFGLWLVPVVFGLDIAFQWREYPAIRRAFISFAPWGTLVTGVYGVIQWVHPPTWDRQWMVDSALVIPGSFGSPEPYAIRVFSTLNGPAAFGVVIGAALLLLVVRFRPAYLVAATAGGLAFLLSLCRTAWIAWIIALIVYAVSLGGRARLRILVIGVGLVLVVVGVIVAAPLAPTGRFTDIVTQRMETLANPTGDVSLDVRENSLKSYVDAILDHPEGYGLGSTGVGTGLSSGDQGGGVRDFDNGALEALYSFGIFGGICWLLGLGTLVLRYAVRPFPPDDRFANAARAVVLFCVVAYGATNTAAGVGGIFLWSGLGLCAAARDWAVHRGAGAAVSGPRGDDPLRLAEHRSPSVRTIASGGRHTSLE